jgi:hypothetical protein
MATFLPTSFAPVVIPAKAGIQRLLSLPAQIVRKGKTLDPGLRRGDDGGSCRRAYKEIRGTHSGSQETRLKCIPASSTGSALNATAKAATIRGPPPRPRSSITVWASSMLFLSEKIRHKKNGEPKGSPFSFRTVLLRP